jgi:signal transduction histidine kinase
MDNTGVTKPTFFWRGILILLPLFLLAGVGLYSLRQDRLLAEVEARERCQNLAQNYAETISAQLLGQMRSLASKQIFAEIRLDEHANLVSIDLSRERARIPRDPILQPLSESELSTAQAKAWHNARLAEFADAAAPTAIDAWHKFLELSPPAPFLSQGRYDLGLLLASGNKPSLALELFSQVQNDRKAVTESGLPLWLLAELQCVQLAPSSLGNIYEDAINNPCFATPVILARVADLDRNPSPKNRKCLDEWEKDRAARDFYLATQALLAARPVGQAFWTMWDGNDWLVMLVAAKGGVEMEPFAKDVVTQALKDVLTNSLSQPSYAQFGVEVAERQIIAVNPQWQVLGSAHAPGYSKNPNFVTVYESLSRPGMLYAQQRTRTIWFAAIILVSAMAALVGFASAHQGFHQQLRLNEMKSNFVSSVSHELRAPIASVRLMAENLEGGKIPEPQKQKEYFSFIVQECRRLSSLIENVLDFSRIEQGRKQYEFEPTNIVSLTQTTVKMMEANSAEKGVKLEMSNHQPPAAKIELNVDGRAIQQALVNLIDNAIKHSAKGQTVTVGIEMPNDPAAAIIQLFVSDRGPGIPAAEHEKIFERFYRRGSELRRETQGVGIGLSIVKHIVEAHGGRVTVQSEPGAGSRFILELPVRNQNE